MSLEELKAKICWAGEEAWLKGNVTAFDELYAADYVWRRPPLPDVSRWKRPRGASPGCAVPSPISRSVTKRC